MPVATQREHSACGAVMMERRRGLRQTSIYHANFKIQCQCCSMSRHCVLGNRKRHYKKFFLLTNDNRNVSLPHFEVANICTVASQNNDEWGPQHPFCPSCSLLDPYKWSGKRISTRPQPQTVAHCPIV